MRVWSHLRLVLAILVPLPVAVSACGGDEHVVAPQTPSRKAVEGWDLHLIDTVKLLNLRTYDGSNQPAHPDFVAPPAPWPKQRRYLVVTPFANSDRSIENPSLFESVDTQRWWAHRKTPNPLVRPAIGYLSDPDIVYDPDRNELWLYFRQVTSDNVIHVITSKDGRQWSDPVEVARAPSHEIVSPSIVRRSATDWWMWSVNAGADGCGAMSTYIERRHSVDGLTWSAPDSMRIAPDGINATPWHIEVQWIEALQEYWALYNAKTSNGCATKALFLATSKDGAHWKTLPNPVLLAGVIPEYADIVYRSTFNYNAETDVVTFWFSGAAIVRNVSVWRTAMQKRDRTTLFKQLNWPWTIDIKSLNSIGYMGIDPPAP